MNKNIMTKNNSIININIFDFEQYCRFGCLCVFSLLKNNNTKAENIHLHLDVKFEHNFYIRLIREYTNINIHLVEYIDNFNFSKISIVNDIFKKYENIQYIINLDADTTFTKDVSLISDISEKKTDKYIHVYAHNINGLTTFNNRVEHLVKKEYINKIDEYIEKSYHIKYELLIKLLENNKWIHGGLILFDRKVFENDKIWSGIINMSNICCSDELIIKTASIAFDAFKFLEIWPDEFAEDQSNSPFKHFFSPRPLNLLDPPAGLVHYAGTEYRSNLEDLNLQIDNIIEQILEKNYFLSFLDYKNSQNTK